MNAIAEAPQAVSAATLEHVLGTGDLSKLTSSQRVEYMTRACELIGLNPLTRPFRFLTFQGQTTMYATRDCADQLRKLHKISLTIVDKTIDSEIYTVTARARTPDGRTDEDMGAVAFGKAIAGEFRANAILKAITKAKRRVTLSICGLGFLDETEVETLPGAQTFDADGGKDKQGQTLEGVATGKPEHGTALAVGIPAPGARETQAPPPAPPPPQDPAPQPAAKPNGNGKLTVRGWLDQFERDCADATTKDAAEEILKRPRVANCREAFKAYPAVIETIERTRQDMIDRFWSHDAEIDAEMERTTS